MSPIRPISFWSAIALTLLALACFITTAKAGDYSFTNSLAQATLAEQRGDLPAAMTIYRQAEQAEATNAANLCVLARRYCDLARPTNAAAMQTDLISHALHCSLQAVKIAPSNATAHASLAVAYARSCAFADIKTQLLYSKLFKQEAEKAIALNPKEDIAWYLLGRWNYEIASVGLLSRMYVRVVYGGLPKASYQAAIANYKKAIALAPQRIIHHAGLAQAYEAAGEKKLAIAEWKQCRALKPTGPEDQDAQRDALRRLAALGQ